jgi:hypothetical protein
MLKRPEAIVVWQHSFGRSLCRVSGLGSSGTHPDSVEGDTMARRVPFPLSNILVYMDSWSNQRSHLCVCNHESNIYYEHNDDNHHFQDCQ